MSEWKEVKLSDIGRIVGGATPSTKNPAYYDGKIPWITPKDLTDWNDVHISRGERSITEEGFNSSSCQMMPKGTVLFSSRAPIGYVAIASNDLCTNQGFKSVVPNTSLIDSEFLYYSLLYNRERIKALGSGTTFAEISGKVMADVVISIPSLATQQKIAAQLSEIDAKIANNRRICENLEAQAQALFKHWFIDFAPFKDGKFVESELGMIPEGWRVGTLGEILKDIETGKRPKGGAESDGIPSIGAEKIERISYYDFSSEKYISKEFFENMKRGKIKNGDVLLYKDGAYTGKSTLFMNDFPYSECAVNEHVFLLRTEDSKWQCWLYLLLSYEPIRKYIHTLASSKAAQPGLNQVELQSVTILIPAIGVLDDFEDIISALFNPIISNLKENLRLTTLRDTLLPKLMSGGIDVNEVM